MNIEFRILLSDEPMEDGQLGICVTERYAKDNESKHVYRPNGRLQWRTMNSLAVMTQWQDVPIVKEEQQ
jgi:hypothetical protein